MRAQLCGLCSEFSCFKAVAIAPVGKTEKTSKIADLSIITTSEDGSCYVESIGSIKKHAREVVRALSTAPFFSASPKVNAIFVTLQLLLRFS